MKNKPFGCLTLGGFVAVLVTLAVVAGVAAVKGGVLFNPGGLSAMSSGRVLGGVRSHLETGGRCSACHAAPWEAKKMAARCLDCHTELAQDLQGFHAVMLSESQARPCYACHPDHNGPDAPLTVMELARFPHEEVGFSLEAHQAMQDGSPFACSDCHGNTFQKVDGQACDDCHTRIDPGFMQAHLASFEIGCLGCHDGLDSYGSSFDHSLAAFPLAGKHAPLDCGTCHAGARTIADLQNAPKDCAACHAQDDAHQGRFGQDCATCHRPEGWDRASFDHSLAAFPLLGKHANIACEDCHRDNVFKGTPQECAACHTQDDAHQGQFGQDCGACHSAEGWRPASFDHSKSAFPLTGAHVDAECAQCHTNSTFKGTPTECAACHADPDFHQGLFGQDCQTCHTTDAWSPAQFNGQHTFPIDHGEGGPSDCRTCHPDSLKAYTCYSCHEHEPNRIASKHREEGISDFQDCARCHPTGQEEEG